MNGRCETDPFDQAINVCGLCYGEFCQSCLVSVRGRKHPLCKDCAILSAGLRAGAKPASRGSRKTAKARRQALAEAPRQEGFQYFEPKPPAGRPTAGSDESASTETPERRSDDKAPAAEPDAATADKAEGDQKTSKKNKRKGRSKTKKSDPVEVEETIDIGARLGGSAAPGSETVTFDQLDERTTADSSATGQSAVDKLDLIRAEHTSEGEGSTFRRPRPFVKDLGADADQQAGSTEPETTSTAMPSEAAGDQPDRRDLPKRRSRSTADPEKKRQTIRNLEDYDDSGTKVAPPKDGEELPTLPRRREKNRNHVRKTPKSTVDTPTSSPSVPEAGNNTDTATETRSFGRLNDPFEPPAWTQQERRSRQRQPGDRVESPTTDDSAGAEPVPGSGPNRPDRRRS